MSKEHRPFSCKPSHTSQNCYGRTKVAANTLNKLWLCVCLIPMFFPLKIRQISFQILSNNRHPLRRWVPMFGSQQPQRLNWLHKFWEFHCWVSHPQQLWGSYPKKKTPFSCGPMHLTGMEKWGLKKKFAQVRFQKTSSTLKGLLQ